MRRTFVVFSVVFAIGITLVNCSKDEELETTGGDKEPTVSEMLMKNVWKEVERTVDGQDVFATLADCETANEYQYLADSIYRIHEGSDTCDPSNPGPTDLEWWLKENNTVLNLGRTDYDLVYVNDSMFKIENASAGGVFTNTYKRK